ncbi:MAG: OmpH family outer membrane protein [Saprospiraceae bacterium]|nr:OmpH family outer membrane protein [Saprospiraceae bacterium]
MRLLFSMLAVVLTVGFASAQKVGHVHSIQLLSQLPEIAVADSLLAIFQVELQAKGDSMLTALQTNYQAYVKESQSGTLSKIQAQTKEAALQEQQTALQGFEQAGQQLIMAKRQALYDPILNKVDEAIKQVGKEEGYQMIFDSSVQAMVFTNGAEDILSKVLAKLGR